jgi:serine/threonine protein phosphatase PrpC
VKICRPQMSRDMVDEIGFNIGVYAATNVGRVRSGNEDNFLVVNLSTADTWTALTVEGPPPENVVSFKQGHYGTVLAVTDGMGGAQAGEVASRFAVESVRDRMLELQASPAYSKYAFPERLRLAIELANMHIHYESLTHEEYAGMGATFTAVGIHGDVAYFAQVGDSRAYMIRNDSVRQITRDQSLVSQLVESGHITEAEAEQHTYKNVILQALGASAHISVAVNKVSLCDGDVLLLCSDGLSNKVRGEEMMEIAGKSPTPTEACDALINLANERGGEDNITVMIARVASGGLEKAEPAGDSKEVSWNIETVPRDPDLPHEVDPALVGSEDDTLSPP